MQCACSPSHRIERKPTLSWSLLLGLWFAVGCVDQDAPDAAANAVAPQCEIGTLDENDVFIPQQDGGTVELVVGYQGFMLIIVRAHTEVGALPELPKVKMTVEREGGEPSVSTVVRAAINKDAKGHDVTESLEMWLYPPAPGEFNGKSGSLQLDLYGRGSDCSAKVNVKFIDEELCKHSEDGSVVCVDGTSKKH